MTKRTPKPAAPARRRPAAAEDVAVDETATALDELLAQYGVAGHTVKLQRQSDVPPRQWYHLGVMDLTPTMVEDVQAQYGGGNFRALVYDAAGVYKRGAIIRFGIAGKPKKQREDDDAAPPDRIARLEALVEKLADAKPAAREPIADFRDMVGVLAPLMKAGRETGGGLDLVATMTMLQQAEERGERRGRELGGLLAGSGDSMVELTGKYLPPIIGLIRENMHMRRNPAALPNTPAAGALPAGAPVVDVPIPAPEYDWLPTLRPFYAQVANQAAHDVDPELTADFCLQQTNGELYTAIATAARRDDFVSVMETDFGPMATTYPVWTREFLSRIVVVCTTDTAAVATTTGGKKK